MLTRHSSDSGEAARNAVAERTRLDEARAGIPWKKWGPYLSERQWAAGRHHGNDPSASLTHDQARSYAYRRGEDGLAGISDDEQRLCFALALWNGRDPILKERLFGLTSANGNHGPDVKECYFYADSTPTHSYMKYLYEYPQREFPYRDLAETNRGRSRTQPEYELTDTGAFEEDRYFEVAVEYAKAAPEDILIRVTVHNHGPEPARLELLPTLWFRNTWASGGSRPVLRESGGSIRAGHAPLGDFTLSCEGAPELLFTDNESNAERLWGTSNPSPYVKDAFHEYVVSGDAGGINPARAGTKAAARYVLEVPPGHASVVRLRLSSGVSPDPFGAEFDEIADARRREADEFFDRIAPESLSADEKRLHRQALAGMLWTKQFCEFGASEEGSSGAESHIVSLPDKWESPRFATWDLPFHAIALSLADADFAREQLLLLLRSLRMRTEGGSPPHEWDSNDVHPPVLAWATLYLFKVQRGLGREDLPFLRQSFHGLLPAFDTWVEDNDPREQAADTGWLAFFCQNMIEIALILAETDPQYDEHAFQLLRQFVRLSEAMNQAGPGQDGTWDDEDGFFYDVVRLPGGTAAHTRVRSIGGLLPLCASTVFPPDEEGAHPRFLQSRQDFRDRHAGMLDENAPTAEGYAGLGGRRLLAALSRERLERVLAWLLDENEFLAPYGIRSLSKYHQDHPLVFRVAGEDRLVSHEPADQPATSHGHPGWRGPVSIPVNALIVRGLLNLYAFYGDELEVECPTGSGARMTLFEVAREITSRLSSIFLKDENGQRPVHGGVARFHDDPHWRDLILFYESFHPETGAGIGASHHTGSTGMIAVLLDLIARLDPEDLLVSDKSRLLDRFAKAAEPS